MTEVIWATQGDAQTPNSEAAMRVLLVGSELEENLALRYLASALEVAGHEVDLAPFSATADIAQVVDAVRRTRPGLVGLSMTFQRRAEEFGDLAERLREDGYGGHLTVGGHFPTFAFREVMERYPAIDSVVRHEGEVTLVELVERLQAGKPLDGIGGLVHRAGDDVRVEATRALATDLDAIHFPKRIGEPQRHMGIPAAFMVGSRGCYGNCTFCCINAYIKDAGGEKYRMRSADNVAEEILQLRRERGARMLVFHDDDFFTRDAARDLKRVTALRDALQRRGVDDVALVLKARPDDLDDAVFRVLREIGLLRIYIGIEAGSVQGLKTLGRGVDIAANQRALDYLRSIDVYACFNMLIFDPETRAASLRQSLAFLRRNADIPMNFCRTEIYPGTPLMRKLEREGRLVGDVFGWDYEISDPAAERAFRVFAHAFLDRNFRCDGLMNSNLSLGYYLHLLQQFYPRAVTKRLRNVALSTIERVNHDCVDFMTEILDFAESERSLSAAAFDDFTAEITERVTAANRRLEPAVAEASEAILEAARGTRTRTQRVGRWTTAAAAAIALSPLACDPLAPPPPPDPLPPPNLREEREGGSQPLVVESSESGFAEPPPDAGMMIPPPDPPPPPTVKPKPPPPPDPLPPPMTKKVPPPPPPPPPPPDPLPPPTMKK
ncbi:MAG: radical SAM protein [Polyangiaceae bacterium]